MRVSRVVINQRTYDREFREDALELLRKSDRTLGAVAESLGIPKTTLWGWYNADMAKKGKKMARSPGKLPVRAPDAETAEEKVARLEAENTGLRKQVDELEMDKAILKKAAAFFAKESG
jgi:transposase